MKTFKQNRSVLAARCARPGRAVAGAMLRASVRGSRRDRSRAGFALVVVLLVLLALLVLTTPFLASARSADQASTQLADRSSARVGLESATTHMRSFLADSYPSADMDKTPYWDGLDEIHADNKFDPAFLNASDPRGAMWDVDLQDVAGSIDLNSASPYVLANMMGLSTRFGDVITPESKTLPLGSATGLEDTGFLWSEGETIQYSKIEGGVVTQFLRGMFGPGEKSDWPGGPRPKSAHGAGTPVVDQRAFAPCLWRLGGSTGELRTYEALEELPQCGMYSHALQLEAPKDGNVDFPEKLVRPMLQNGTVYAGSRGGPVWQRATRVASAVQGKKDGKLRVESARWLNIGATVRIRDGQSTELALVQNVLGNGEIALDHILQEDYEAYSAVLDVLVRRPVNLNTANRDVLRILFTNLQVVGHNSRITSDEADKLADLVIESRPLTGLEDFLRRIVLPAAAIEKLPSDAPVAPAILQQSGGFLDPWDAVALYMNGLDANDAGLQYSTMPYSFTTRDTYACEMRSTINAPSGVERFTLIRDQVMLVAPQKELTRLWSRQEDFEEEFRLTGDAPFFATGPSATTRYDGGSVPPSRMWAHLGTYQDQLYMPGVTDTSQFKDQESPPTPEHIFASREAQGWIQLATLREYDGSARRKGRVLHFDNETRDLEGRYLPDEVVKRATDDKQIAWTAGSNAVMLRPLALSMWIKPKAVGQATYLDVGGVSSDVDRVSLLTEGSDLVLRVIDGFGDNNLTTLKEAGELRFAMSGGNSPGLPADTWSHVEFDVRGNRPSQMHMLVNGLAYGVRTPGMSRLTGGLSQGGSTIAVESTEGFPETCVVRVGNELIEVQNRGNGVLDAARQETGKLAGFGGRLAREEMTTLTDTGSPAPINLATIATSHPAGTPVEVFGYSLQTVSDVPTGEARVAADLAPFRVAIVRSVITTSTGDPMGEPIQITTPFGPYQPGSGMKGVNSGVTGLVLASADDGLDTSNPRPASDYMPTFSANGGYAAIVQVNPVYQNVAAMDSEGAKLGGIEIIRYTGVQGTTLLIDQQKRGIGASELPDLAVQTPHLGGMRSFVVNWDHNLGGQSQTDPTPWWRAIDCAVFVVPISIAVPGAGTVNGFLDGQAGNDHFAQFTHVDDAENTEWVQYDRFVASLTQLVRDDPHYLEILYRTLTHEGRPVIPNPIPGGGGGGGGTPPGGTGGGQALMLDMAEPVEPLAPMPSAAQSYGSNWKPNMGETANKPTDFPISRAAEINFQFRGVCATYSHKQPAGTPIHPAFEVRYFPGVDGGRPGRMDAVFLAGSNPDHVGWPVRVHRAYVFSAVYDQLSWDQPPVTHGNASALRPVTAAAGGIRTGVTASQITPPYLQNRCFVALQQRGPEPLIAGSAASSTLDSRLMTRVVCFPSGERPRLVNNMAIGGGVNGAPGAIPSAVVDEVVFGDAQFGRAMPIVNEEDVAGASLILTQDADDGAQTLNVAAKAIRIAVGNAGADHLFLNDMTVHGGLLRVGDEIVAYKSYGADVGEIHLATNGRGLLGTKPGAHQAGEPVMFLEHRLATTLSAPLSAGDAQLKVEDTMDFPQAGVVLVGQELIGYTRLRDSSLEMPRASSEPGRMDRKGDGIFRGRYGTTMAAHAAGEAVILFPVRYPDRWAKRADAPELGYFGMCVDQPAAYFGSVYFSKEDTSMARIGVLQRTDPSAPWDADTDLDNDPRVKLFWQGEKNGAPLAIGKQSDRVDWRVFVQYQPGAFDATTGLSHGWKETPRLKMFSAFYHAPSLVLRSVER